MHEGEIIRMRNVSGVKKVEEVLGVKQVCIYDKINGRKNDIYLDENRTYIIPGYQREIRWSAENVQILIDDLKKGSKFLGTITLSTSEVKKFEVIDGQQRLTVITMLIKYLNNVVPENKRHEGMCKIDNQSFIKFNEVLSYDFDYLRIKDENKALYDEALLNDPLSQSEDFKKIWNSIAERIDSLSPKQRIDLFTALVESDLNVIVNEIEGTDTQRKFCVDYFIDINNKSVDLDSLDIIRAYAFREDFGMMATKWINIQNLCNELQESVKYTRDILYFQYFICKVNKELDYKITKLSENYTTKEDVEINGKKYSFGTYVWNMFSNDSFYSTLFEDLNGYLDFIKVVIGTETGGNDKFKEYFIDESGRRADETRILNAHTIINVILRNDDLVPKMMVMKYYLEILKPKNVKGNRYKIINQIYAISNVITTGRKRKGSEQIANRLLQENWEQAIRDYAYKMVLEVPSEIGFDKVAKVNKTYTVESGQYMARRYIGMLDAYTWDNGNITVDEDAFKNINITTGDKNIEHFIVNRKYGYALYLEDGTTTDIEISIPGKYRKNIATIANYIILNSHVNAKLGNRPVYEKIEMLETEIEENGINYVIPSKTSRLHYYLIKKVMHDESKYPAKEINKEEKKSKRKEILRNYYRQDFEDEFKKLTDAMAHEELVIAAKLEYELLKKGFVKKGDEFIFEADIKFSNIAANIDVKNEKLVMATELYNPWYGEEEDEDSYLDLIKKTIKGFSNKYGKEPCIRSSNEWGGSDDESFVFSYIFEPEVDNAVGFLRTLEEISCTLI